ncbi:putative bifunctional diguanylate cyclase/phosphodiesterase [Litorilituus lipolyticus]|uniref:EAL domain-containing protein n=1 Tax=Litorilituus lipolyticus TaxID=2491017 RepID=A0A502L1V4_9GAMM|nr:EAL domain-containing protein [Litorilituus lipolyticus]TPH16455.1 EAL domain-containing protein [Litorilituus lipolyticus]
MVEEKVKSIIDSLSHSVSDKFTDTICLSLAEVIKADIIFIASINEDATEATTVSLASQGQIQENFTYLLKHTPCENVSTGGVCSYTENCQKAYPDDQLLVDLNITGYVGVPLKAENGKTDAILVALYHKVIESEKEVTSLFLLFSGMIKKEMEKQALFNELATRNRIIEVSKEAIVVCDKNAKIISVNKAFTDILGYSFREVEGENPKIFSSGEHGKEFYSAMWNEIKETGSWSGEIWNKKKSGEVFPEWLSINTICDADNNITNYVAFFFDISKSKAAETKIYKQANFDLLTGIANRFLFLETLAQSLHLVESSHKSLAVLHMDLDLFKEINDIYGHDLGDKLLIESSKRLKNHIKKTDCIARISGDSFAILLNELDAVENVEAIVERILLAFSNPFVFDDVSLTCTLSIGIAICSAESENEGSILKKAETAMYHAKDSGRNSYSFFTQKMQNIARRKLMLKSQLALAIENKELSVVYQPIISIGEQKVRKFEALIRWNNFGEWISPEEFVGIAEEFSLIKPLGSFVLTQACLELKKLKSQGFTDIIINVNRSVFEIPLNKSENDLWLNTIAEHDLQPQDICFELTESALAPDKRNNEVLFNQLRSAGCTIALDDFGTGYSSLSYLRRIPIDFIKIDRAFISDMSENQSDNILVSTIIAMSKALGKKVVAEGVETLEQLNLLSDLGCDYIQGYYFSKPLPSAELASYLTDFSYHQ